MEIKYSTRELFVEFITASSKFFYGIIKSTFQRWIFKYIDYANVNTWNFQSMWKISLYTFSFLPLY